MFVFFLKNNFIKSFQLITKKNLIDDCFYGTVMCIYDCQEEKCRNLKKPIINEKLNEIPVHFSNVLFIFEILNFNIELYIYIYWQNIAQDTINADKKYDLLKMMRNTY